MTYRQIEKTGQSENEVNPKSWTQHFFNPLAKFLRCTLELY